MTTTTPRKRAATKPAAPYHHGNLPKALLAATIAIIEERGVEHVSVREAARRAGASPAAPFRHFANKTALLTAVAEQAMERLKSAVDTAVAATAQAAPLARLEALGAAYLTWALQNPTHFQIISSRSLIDIGASETIGPANDAIRTLMARLLAEAQADGTCNPDLDIQQVVLMTRAFGYGLARMAIDGHMAEWHPAEPVSEAVPKALRLFMSLLAPKVPLSQR